MRKVPYLAALPGGNTRSVLYHSPFPFRFVSGRDCYVTSLDGHEYLDCVSEYSAGIYGHSCTPIKEAIKNALDSGISLGGHNAYEMELAKLIKARFDTIELIRFTNSGTEANIMALNLAVAHTGRRKILVFDNGYHGGCIGFHGPDNPMNIPHDFVLGTFNDVESTTTLIRDDIAAVIVEPIQGAGGVIPATFEFLDAIRKATDAVGALLIFDEVMTSRMGPKGMQGHFGIRPDITTLGKYLGGGLSFGAFGGRQDLMSRFDPRLSKEKGGLPHSGTFNNNVLSMVAGIAGAKLLTPETFLSMNALGDLLRENVNGVATRLALCKFHATGFGSLVGFHFSGDNKNTMLELLYFRLIEQRIYIGRRGFVSLNMMHRQSHIKSIIEAIQTFLEAWQTFLR